MFNLERYIGPNEEILFRFGISFRYVITLITLSTIGLGSLSAFFQLAGFTGFFNDAPLVLLIFIIIWVVTIYLTTGYFITNEKIYKKIGIGFTKVSSAKKTEIDDLQIIQSLNNRFLFGSGTLKFNTPGSAGFEIILPQVNDPFETKREIYRVWGF